MLDKKVLYTRAISAVVFAAIVVVLLNYSRLTIFLFLVLLSFFATYEYIKIKLGDRAGLREKIITPLLFGVLPVAIDYFMHQLNFIGFNVLLFITLVFDFYLMYKLFKGKDMLEKNEIVIYFEALFYIGIPVLLASNLLLIGLDSKSIIIFILILLIWANDTFAYLTGSLFGKNKLMPSVSPGKTIEGFVGGGLFTLVVSILLFYYFNTFSIYFYLILGSLVWTVGTIGDLIESKMKRSYGIKDSGTIMPGHGGFLDRFDSFIFVLPFVILMVYLFL